MTPSRLAPFTHPLAPIFFAAVDSLGAALAPESTRLYRGTARAFLMWLGTDHPDVASLHQLRRDPHILGWMTALRSRVPPLAPVTYITRIISLRGILSELAYTAQLAELGQLLRRQDIPRRPRSLPRALPAEHDQLLQQELLRRNDLGSNFFLLLRHTGMRIGEAVDLAFDCLHTSGPDQWTIHVPLGKLKTERMVPVDSFTRDLVHRLRFFRGLDPSASGRPAAGTALFQASAYPPTPLLSSRSFCLRRHSRPHRSASAPPHLRQRDASLWRRSARTDEVARPCFSRDDHGLPRHRAHRPTP